MYYPPTPRENCNLKRVTCNLKVSARYPVAVALQAALSGLGNVKKMMNEDSTMLLVAYLDPIREAVNEAMGGTKRNQRCVHTITRRIKTLSN